MAGDDRSARHVDRWDSAPTTPHESARPPFRKPPKAPLFHSYCRGARHAGFWSSDAGEQKVGGIGEKHAQFMTPLVVAVVAVVFRDIGQEREVLCYIFYIRGQLHYLQLSRSCRAIFDLRVLQSSFQRSLSTVPGKFHTVSISYTNGYHLSIICISYINGYHQEIYTADSVKSTFLTI